MAHATYETQGRRLAVVALLAAAGAGLLPMGTEVGFGVTLQNDPTPAAPGAIVRAAVSSVANTVATNVVTVARPAGTAPGDTLVACLTLNGSSIASGGVPSGWSAMTVASTLSNPRVFGYSGVPGPWERGSYSWLLPGSVTNGAGTARYTGVDAPSPLDGAPSSAGGLSGSPPTVPSVTTASAGSMLVGCLGINSGSTSVLITSPAGMTEAWGVGGRRGGLARPTPTSQRAPQPQPHAKPDPNPDRPDVPDTDARPQSGVLRQPHRRRPRPRVGRGTLADPAARAEYGAGRRHHHARRRFLSRGVLDALRPHGGRWVWSRRDDADRDRLGRQRHPAWPDGHDRFGDTRTRRPRGARQFWRPARGPDRDGQQLGRRAGPRHELDLARQ